MPIARSLPLDARVVVAAICVGAGCTPDYVKEPPRAPPEPTPPAAARLLLTADLHAPSFQRGRVLGAMRRAQRDRPADAVLAVGDNVYDCGPDMTLPGADRCDFAPDGNTVPGGLVPPVDARMESASAALAGVAQASDPPAPVFVSLGNHDVAAGGDCEVPGREAAAVARARACLEVAHRGPGWRMPGRHYVIDAGPLRIIVIDANLLKGDYGGFTFDDEERFVREAARVCGGRLCFLASHFPPATTGPVRRREPPAFLARVDRLEAAAAPFQAWLTGHHHDLQHLRTRSGRDVFVFGNSSAGAEYRREETSPPGTVLEFHSTRWGFATLEAAGDRWWFRFVDVRGRGAYCCAASRGQPCLATKCPGAESAGLTGASVTVHVTITPPAQPD